MNPSLSRPIATLALTALVAAGCPLPALAQSVSVTLNGQPLSVSPEPQERAGRIFVPLRGIFEQLGASVVYQNGTINAQGRGRRSISLHVGSTQALVNGQPQALDVAPFIVGASTFVPLRFISQALGAHVNYDGTNKIVAIDTAGMNMGGPPPDQQQPQPPPPADSAMRLGHVRPAEGASVAGLRPTIEATFENVPVDPNTLQISLDDTDITSQTSRSPSGFVFSPPSDLQSMQHTVRVRGVDRSGAHFVRVWHFTTGTVASPVNLFVESPRDGQRVGPTFTVRGRTAPGAFVVVQAGVSRDALSGFGAVFGSGGFNVREETRADAQGFFSLDIQVDAPPGVPLRVAVSATDPRTQSGAPPVVRNVTLGNPQ